VFADGARAQGTLRLSADANPALFELARVGLGALGVVAEVTLQCVPAHQLLEHTFVTTAQARRPRPARLVYIFDLVLKHGARFCVS
jgi:L-galactono-1,4-lactone dehydrogenase